MFQTWKPFFCHGMILITMWASSVPAEAASFFCGQWFGRQSRSASHVPVAVAYNFFTPSRGLFEYVSGFVKGFSQSLAKLEKHETWIDLGAGEGRAVEEYVRSEIRNGRTPAQAVILTYKLGRFFKMKNYDGKIKILQGRLFEEIPDAEIPQAQLMTDFFGVLSYTRDLTRSLEKAFSHLKVGGELYLFSDSKSTPIEIGSRVVSLTTLLQTIPGLQVEGSYGILKITKLSNEILVPKMKLVAIDEKTRPFHRRFRIE